MEERKLVAGRNAVREALKAGRSLDKLYILKGAHETAVNEIIDLARAGGAVVKFVDRQQLSGLMQRYGELELRHQGVAGTPAAVTYVRLEDILARAQERGEPPFVVVLDSIEDPHNLGAVIRSAECFGAHGVVIKKDGAVGVNATVYRASAGAAAHMPVAREVNLTQTLRLLKERGLWVAGADMEGQPVAEVDLSGPLALVIGAEGKGLSRLVKSNCDFLARIPIQGAVGSLNASVAAGVMMYERARRMGGV